MWKGNYGKEPFDLRLTALRLIFHIHWILAFTVLGTLLFGGGYYVKNVIFRPESAYAATSTYKVDYADESWAQYGTYINEATWNTWVHTKEFLDNVQRHLQEGELPPAAASSMAGISNEELSGMLSAKLASDLRVPSTVVTTADGELSVLIAGAVEQTMTEDFAQNVPNDISTIRVIDPALAAEEVLWDVRPIRAFVLSGVLSCFFAVVIFLLKELGDDSIWLPATLYKRYGLKTLGTVHSRELKANIAYFCQGMERIAVCPVDENVNPAEVSQGLHRAESMVAEHNNSEKKQENEYGRWSPAPTPLLCPDTCSFLRQADGIVLAVQAGSHAGKRLEYVMEFLQQQDCKITAAILWNADETLIRRYYCFSGAGRLGAGGFEADRTEKKRQ